MQIAEWGMAFWISFGNRHSAIRNDLAPVVQWIRMPGFQPENDGFNSLREQWSFRFISVWRSLAAHVPRAHGVEGSNPSTLTDERRKPRTRRWQNGNAAGRNPADSMSHMGVQIPPYALGSSVVRCPWSVVEKISYAVGSSGGTLDSKSGKGRFDPCTACSNNGQLTTDN